MLMHSYIRTNHTHTHTHRWQTADGSWLREVSAYVQGLVGKVNELLNLARTLCLVNMIRIIKICFMCCVCVYVSVSAIFIWQK